MFTNEIDAFEKRLLNPTNSTQNQATFQPKASVSSIKVIKSSNNFDIRLIGKEKRAVG